MLVYCLVVVHWSVPSQYTITLALTLAVVLTVRVTWSMVKEKFGRTEPAIPRVQSVCDEMRRRRAANYSEPAAQEAGEVSGCSVAPL
ncbi:MAG TPA: hypothetical protein VJT08_03890 [Terriglobales bacterium]|nr:hypothetical protein [Acidobacteriaceae bacterium]HKR29588.1 hypothetical protein [Terriglobales bacterium]